MFTKYEKLNAKVMKAGQGICQGICQVLSLAIQVKVSLLYLFRVELNLSCLPSERVELTVNRQKETNGRVKNKPRVKGGQGSK